MGATGLMMEASLGTIWGEDPRYYRAEGRPIKDRLLNVLTLTFLARNERGKLMPAYARYITVPANSYLSNAWRADSHATTPRAVNRIELSFVDRIIGNSFSEFWPDFKKQVLRRH